MADTYQPAGIREESRIYYSNPENVERKWISQYGRMSWAGDYQINKSCIQEVFNMLDVVAENKINEFLADGERLPTRDENTQYPKWGVRKDGREYWFLEPTNFHRRVKALSKFGYDLSIELDTNIRIVRNNATHGNKTIARQHISLDYENTRDIMLGMADALIVLGMLPSEERIPSFEKLRVHEGSELREGEYKIGSLIGEGGMSRVYVSTHKRLGRRLAIKELKPGTFSRETVTKECSVLLWLHHESIPHIYDTFFENTTYYIVMEYVDGQSLERYCERKIVTEKERLRLAIEICEILQYLHSSGNGIIYADLKPQNILVDREGKIHLVDFGISRHIMEMDVCGWTSSYVAPEVAKGIPGDCRTDIYSYGKVLEYIYSGSEQEGSVREAVHRIIFRCTEQNPLDRYASIGDVLNELYELEEKCGYRKIHGTKQERNRADILRKTRNSQIKKRLNYIVSLVIILVMLLEISFIIRWIVSLEMANSQEIVSLSDGEEIGEGNEINYFEINEDEMMENIEVVDIKYLLINRRILFLVEVYNGNKEKIVNYRQQLDIEIEFEDDDRRRFSVTKTVPELKANSSTTVTFSGTFKQDVQEHLESGIRNVLMFYDNDVLIS